MHAYEIQTARLLLRPLTVADTDAVWKRVSDARVTRYMVYLTYKDKEQVRAWLRSAGSKRMIICSVTSGCRTASCKMRSMEYEGDLF